METPFSHYKSMDFFFFFFLRNQGQLTDLAEIRTHPIFYACPRYLQV